MKEFNNNYLESQIRALFNTEKYVCKRKAIEIINASSYIYNKKLTMISIINMILNLGGLYELEKAIDNETIPTPSNYGNLNSFRKNWLKKISFIGNSTRCDPRRLQH